MFKNNKGVTMMTLIITIIVIVILVSITGYYSIESIKNSYTSKNTKELSDVVEYVSVKKAKLLIGELDVNEEFNNEEGKSPAINNIERLEEIASGLTINEKNKIIEVNTSDYITDNYKYLYISGDKLNEESIAEEDIVIKDVKNNYIINFFTGTVIALYDDGKNVSVSGVIKDLNTILNEM